MFLIFFLIAFQIALPSAYANQTQALPTTQGENPTLEPEEDDNNICLQNCHQKASKLPTCHDPKCKKQNQAEIKKCKEACKPKNSSEAPDISACLLQCTNASQIQQMECEPIDQMCLQNAQIQSQMCVQNCYNGAVLKAAN